MRIHHQFLLLGLFVCLFFIGLTGAAQAEYNDLETIAISVTPTAPALNQPCTVKVTIKNSGDTTLYTSAGLTGYDVNFRDFVETGATVPVPPLAPGGSAYYSISGYFTSEGEKNIGFEVNSENQLIELNTGNNYFNTKVTIVPQYDIEVTSIAITPSKPVENQEAIIKVAMKNTGYARLWTNAGISAYNYTWPDFNMTSTDIPVINSEYPVESGGVFYYTYHGKFTSAGAKTLSFTIDNTNQLKEKNESNNSATVAVTIYPADSQGVAVQSMSLNIATPLKDEALAITVKIKNSGQSSIINSTGILLEDNLSSWPIIYRDINYQFTDFAVTSFVASAYPSMADPFDPGEVLTYTYGGSFSSAGEKALSFSVNQNNRLSEDDAEDNLLEQTVAVYEDAATRDAFDIVDYGAEFYSTESVRIWWNTSRPTTGRVEYKRSDYTAYQETTDSSKNGHSLKVTGLSAGLKYDYIIHSTYGTVTEEIEKKIFTMPSSNEIKLTLNPVATVSGGQSTITWGTNLLATSKVYYRNSDNEEEFKTAETSGEILDHQVVLKSLPAGNYEYYVVSQNEAGEIFVSIKYNFVVITAATVEELEEAPVPEAPASSEESAPAGKTASSLENTQAITNQAMYKRLKGKIILTVEANGEAYYINPAKESRHYLGRPEDAFGVMREQGIGITNENLKRISIGQASLSGPDNDGDGLSDIFEDAIGTDKNTKDTDSDGHDDNAEVYGQYNPNGFGNMPHDAGFASSQAGKIFLQVEGNGEAWYVNPGDNKRYFLGRPADAFSIMRTLGLGISNADFNNL